MPERDGKILRLSAGHLNCLNSVLDEFAPGAEVWAYGSRVTGAAHEASDLDLVLRNTSNLEIEYTGFIRLKTALVESDLPIRVEVVDWARIPEKFKEEIKRGYVILKEE